MKNIAMALLFSALFVGLVSMKTSAQTRTKTRMDTDAIFPKGQRAPAANFTGTVWVQQLIEPDSAFNIPVRLAWFYCASLTDRITSRKRYAA